MIVEEVPKIYRQMLRETGRFPKNLSIYIFYLAKERLKRYSSIDEFKRNLPKEIFKVAKRMEKSVSLNMRCCHGNRFQVWSYCNFRLPMKYVSGGKSLSHSIVSSRSKVLALCLSVFLSMNVSEQSDLLYIMKKKLYQKEKYNGSSVRSCVCINEWQINRRVNQHSRKPSIYTKGCLNGQTFLFTCRSD